MRNHLEWLRSGSTITLKSWLIKLFFIVSCCFMLMLALGGTAFAYNRNAAVAYADEWALSRNSNNFPSYGADCTNFVSQALRSGGYAFVGTPQQWSNSTDDNQWWGNWNYIIGYFYRTYSWSVAPDQYQFEMNHYPGGWLKAIVTASDNAYWAQYDNASMIGGDLLFFDWGQGEGMSHVAFQVWAGYSQYYQPGVSWYGDLSDQHTADRYHVSWSHTEVNPDWPTTTIWEVHIDNGN